MKRVTFIPSGDIENAGARFRAYWPAQFMPNATVATWPDIRAGKLPDADAYVFQKLVDVALMTRLRERGALVFWDVCDPVWWFNPTDASEAAKVSSGMVASSDALAADLTEWGGRRAHVIADRVWLGHYTRQCRHEDRAPVRFIWYGSAQNRIALYGAAANMARLRADGHDVTLTVFDNAPESPIPGMDADFPVYYTRWTLARESETLAAHDIALLPPYPGPWGVVKSNNRTLSAWATGLPVTSGMDYRTMVKLVTDVELRRTSMAAGLDSVRREWNIERSASEWTALIEEHNNDGTD